MKTPTQKTKFVCDSSLSLSKYRAVGQSQPTVRRQNVTQQQVSAAAVRNARKKKKLRRLILITAVKFYSKMKTPTQKNKYGSDSSLSLSNYRLVNPIESHGNPIRSCWADLGRFLLLFAETYMGTKKKGKSSNNLTKESGWDHVQRSKGIVVYRRIFRPHRPDCISPGRS